jgi:hypothetical protein
MYMFGSIKHESGAGASHSQSLPNLDLSKVPFDEGATIFNRSKRFIIPVPVMPGGGEPLEVPPGQPEAGRVIYTDEKAGVNFASEGNGNGLGRFSISDGQEIIVVNGVVKLKADEIESRVRALSGDPENISPGRMIQIFRIHQSEFGLDSAHVDFRPVKPQHGLVFYNPTDRAWQGVQGNGLEAIVINDVTPEQATKLYRKIDQLTNDPDKLGARQLREILHFATQELGLVDFFDKDQESVTKQMGLVDPSLMRYDFDGISIAALGYMQVTKETPHKALFIAEPFAIPNGPVAQRYLDGAVVVSDGRYSWGVAGKKIDGNWAITNGNGKEVTIQSAATELPHYAIRASGRD